MTLTTNDEVYDAAIETATQEIHSLKQHLKRCRIALAVCLFFGGSTPWVACEEYTHAELLLHIMEAKGETVPDLSEDWHKAKTALHLA